MGQYLASTLPSNEAEVGFQLELSHEDKHSASVQKLINQRNAILDVLFHLLSSDEDPG